MKRFSSTEKGALILAATLLLAGVSLIVWPLDMAVTHPINDTQGTPAGVVQEPVTKTGSRVYGGISILFGVGIAALVFCGGRSDS